MTLLRKTPPAALPVTLEAVYSHLRLILEETGGSPSEALPVDHEHVRLVTEGAVSEIDGANGYLGVALIEQVWTLLLDRFPPFIALPVPPLREVVAIQYLDSAGEEQTLSPADYRVTGVGGLERALIRPRSSWPATQNVPEAVLIEFRCGFGDAPDDVPAGIRGAILELIATRYRFRESVSASSSFSTLPESATSVLNLYRDWNFGG